MHPVGTDYNTLYDFLNCVHNSPCWGWMNSNSTVRDFTSSRAAELSAIYPEIIATQSYNNFKMYYLNETFNGTP